MIHQIDLMTQKRPVKIVEVPGMKMIKSVSMIDPGSMSIVRIIQTGSGLKVRKNVTRKKNMIVNRKDGFGI